MPIKEHYIPLSTQRHSNHSHSYPKIQPPIASLPEKEFLFNLLIQTIHCNQTRKIPRNALGIIISIAN